MSQPDGTLFITLLGNFEREPLGRDPTESASGAMLQPRRDSKFHEFHGF